MKHFLIAILVIGSVFTTCHLTGSTAYAANNHSMDSGMAHDMSDETKDTGGCNCNFNQKNTEIIRSLPLINDSEDDLIEFLHIGLLKYIQLPLNNFNDPPKLSNYVDHYESQFFKNIHSVKLNR